MRRVWNAFFYSMAGLRWALSREAAVRQELGLLLLALPLALLVGGSWPTRGLLVAALWLVLIVEFLNTAIEKLCDHVRPERHEDIKVIKDLGSAACFLTQSLAAATWLAVLLGRFL